MGSALDTLYGSGSSARLHNAVQRARPGHIITESANPDGSVHVEVHWGSDLVRMSCSSDNVHFAFLSTTCTPNGESTQTTYPALCRVLPDLFKSLGVRTFTAATLTEATTKIILTAAGEFKPVEGQGTLVWDL